MPATPEFEEMIRARSEASDRIVRSRARKKLIVAGPGTGKTYTFKEALEAVGGGGLALTFIRNLVRDLEGELSELADVFTFHGFCKYLLHRIGVEGISSAFDFYPPLLSLVAEDLKLRGRGAVSREAIEERLQDLNPADGAIDEAIEIENYYDAVSFTDIVYRVFRHLEGNPNDTPAYPLVVVDEYQDFSRLETSFIAQLATRSPVLIAGDDDQALYTFKHASAIYIRELASDGSYERFELPFCSRCPEVIVEAVQRVVDRALGIGKLVGRLERNYHCFLPEKKVDSEQHPKIIHAHCSVENNRAPYVCRYVAEEISKIPAGDIQESHEEKYPTALVIGPGQFVRRVHAFLTKGPYPDAQLRESGGEMPIDMLHGYSRIARDQSSRLGWRVLIHCDPFEGYGDVVGKAIREGADLVEAVPDDYRSRHLGSAALIGRLMDGEELDEPERTLIESALARPIEKIQSALVLEVRDEATEEESTELPSVVCTTLVGAKGLSAGYVFIVGFNDGHFPQHPEAITDEDICKLIVGLSRTGKECHLVSCGRFGGGWLSVSSFLEWIEPLTEYRNIDKRSWK